MIKTQEKRGREKMGSAQKRTAFLFLLPRISGVSIFVMIPFAKVVVSSFCTALTGRFVGLRNYEAVFQNTAFRLAAGNTARFIGFGIPLLLVFSLQLALIVNSGRGRGNSVKTAVFVLAGQLLIGTHGAWAFAAYNFRGKHVLFSVYVILMLLPFQVTMLARYLVLNGMGLLDTHAAVILPAVFSTFPVFLT